MSYLLQHSHVTNEGIQPKLAFNTRLVIFVKHISDDKVERLCLGKKRNIQTVCSPPNTEHT